MKSVYSAVALGAILAIGATAHANSFTNGGFETTNGLGQFNYGGGLDVTGWYVPDGGYTFVGDASTIGAGGVPLYQYGGNIDFWAAGNGGTNAVTASPDGGNFILSDGAYERQPLNQDITGLVIGHTYKVTYYYGAAQQYGFTGDTTDKWTVSLGGTAPQDSAVISSPSHTFTAWSSASAKFVATATNETLSFQAIGTPDGVPPFALLDGVTFSPDGVPEPAAWALMLIGLGGLGAIARRRRAGISVEA